MKLVRIFRRCDDPAQRHVAAIADSLTDLDSVRLAIGWMQEDVSRGRGERAMYWRRQAERVVDVIRQRLLEAAG